MLDQAVDAFKMVSNLNPEYKDVNYNIGLLYTRIEDFDKSTESFKEAIRIHPNDTKSHVELGRSYISQNFIQNAISSFELALRIDQQYAPAYYYMGSIQSK